MDAEEETVFKATSNITQSGDLLLALEFSSNVGMYFLQDGP